jgi:hypothetical protein
MIRRLGLGAVVVGLVTIACSGGTTSLDGNPDGGGSSSGGIDAPCPAGGASVTFELKVQGNKAFCDSTGCAGTFLQVTRADGTPVPIDQGCVGPCNTCEAFGCTAECRQPLPIGPNGLTKTWNGNMYLTSSCTNPSYSGTRPLTCFNRGCAEAGTYFAKMCGYPLPAGDGGADAGALDRCESASRTPQCVQVQFTWPTTGTVTGTLGAL